MPENIHFGISRVVGSRTLVGWEIKANWHCFIVWEYDNG